MGEIGNFKLSMSSIIPAFKFSRSARLNSRVCVNVKHSPLTVINSAPLVLSALCIQIAIYARKACMLHLVCLAYLIGTIAKFMSYHSLSNIDSSSNFLVSSLRSSSRISGLLSLACIC